MYKSSSVIDILKKVGKKTKSALVKDVTEDKTKSAALEAASCLFHEAMGEVREGSMSWIEAIDDLYENLKAIDMPKGKEKGDSEGE